MDETKTSQQIPIEQVQRGDVVRFLPRLRRRRVTVHVTHWFDGVAVVGYRASYDGTTLVSRGEARAYFALPGAEVELLRRGRSR